MYHFGVRVIAGNPQFQLNRSCKIPSIVQDVSDSSAVELPSILVIHFCASD